MFANNMSIVSFIIFIFFVSFSLSSAQLRRDFYAGICPEVETIVRTAVEEKVRQTRIAIAGTLRLFFHDCIANGCDASIMIASTDNNTAEKDYSDNLSLPGDGFDTVIKAKQALDGVSNCRNKISCADILTIAARDAVNLAGGPRYEVELGRLDSLSSTAASVEGKLPQPTDNVGKLMSVFAANGLNLTDIIALSGAHTIGVTHCNKIKNRIYNFNNTFEADPTLNTTYVSDLKSLCPKQQEDTHKVIVMDPTTPIQFDNSYYKNLQFGKGLFTSDQDLFINEKSKSTINLWANNQEMFFESFANSMTKLGRVGVKTGPDGNIRRDCAVFN